MLNQLCMPPVGNEGTGSEGSSSPSSPRDSSDENERGTLFFIYSFIHSSLDLFPYFMKTEYEQCFLRNNQ